ncbi:MAG: GNAT family N-acetyltransferase [Phycisphaerales bacterium]|nr:GNAT family N-acetyltransferase [Phycisphaerales bacterium]
MNGEILGIQICPAAGAPPIPLDRVRAVAGVGLEGDHNAGDQPQGTSKAPGDWQITLIEEEALRAAADEAGVQLSHADSRRNLLCRGVPLAHLIGRRFRIGSAVLRGARQCEPCKTLESRTQRGAVAALLHRGGLRAQVLRGGEIRVGDAVAWQTEHHEWRRGELCVSTDTTRLDADVVHDFLRRTAWAAGIPRETVLRSLCGALCFGLYDGERQIGVARVITDRSTYAYLSDVFIEEPARGRGLAAWLMECILAHPELQGLRRFVLSTMDAHGLYARFGFGPPRHPDRYMEILNEGIYRGG